MVPVLLEDLAEAGEGDGCAVAPEVWLQSLFQHRNSLVHQVEEWTMTCRGRERGIGGGREGGREEGGRQEGESLNK